MIIVKLIGGLGNQMFQYAVGRNLAIKNNCMLKLDISGFKGYKLRNYDLVNFNVQENIATSNDLMGVILPTDNFILKARKHLERKISRIQDIQYIREKKIDFNPKILILKDNKYLDGYWQSEKYFSDISDVIRKEFTLIKKADPINESYLGDIVDCESVSVHIRRGDYVSDPRTTQVHGFLGLEYYQRALKLMLEKKDNSHFFVFSDDPQWAKMNLITSKKITFIEHNCAKNYEDLRLMTHCKHHITANSTFSWWGAWLCQNEDKIIIAPKKWFNDESINSDDLIPKSWIRL